MKFRSYKRQEPPPKPEPHYLYVFHTRIPMSPFRTQLLSSDYRPHVLKELQIAIAGKKNVDKLFAVDMTTGNFHNISVKVDSSNYSIDMVLDECPYNPTDTEYSGRIPWEAFDSLPVII